MGDRQATHARILAAARELFAEDGYDQVTVRTIARAADANVALVNRYFGSKAGLFAEVVATESTVDAALLGDPARLPARLAARTVRRMAAGDGDPIVRIVDRAGMSPEIRAVLRARVESALVKAIEERLDGPHARERATLAAMVMLGAGSLRRLLGQDSFQDADPDVLEARLTAVFTACLAHT
ncbi:TetR family transcriptional regulator [Streptosporangiaceae bacterium NEAU-GS5]|nr:TetR family transcriptional regulator [Streptosporangiaceae bacterium NEAU-GS5]